MKSVVPVFAVLFGLLSRGAFGEEPVEALPPKDRFFLFLLAGQSNMAGRGEIGERDRVTDERILVFSEDLRWRVAREPLHWDRPGRAGVGPGLPFARAVLPHLPPDAAIGLIPVAFGGTRIEWWGKEYRGDATFYGDRYLYEHAVERAGRAMRHGRLAGILWNQGESDGSAAELDGGEEYRRRLHGLIADLRSDLGAPEVPFIGATLGPWRDTPALNAVYRKLPDEVTLTAIVDTHDPGVIEDLVNDPGDPPHYVTKSYRLLGRLYAERFLSLHNPAEPHGGAASRPSKP